MFIFLLPENYDEEVETELLRFHKAQGPRSLHRLQRKICHTVSSACTNVSLETLKKQDLSVRNASSIRIALCIWVVEPNILVTVMSFYHFHARDILTNIVEFLYCIYVCVYYMCIMHVSACVCMYICMCVFSFLQ